MHYSEDQMMILAKNNPKELIKILTGSNININTLTFGAEILGSEVADEALVLPVFKQLLKHINAIVREGAMVGICAFYSGNKPPQDILDKLTFMSEHDPSITIKEYAQSLLEDYK